MGYTNHDLQEFLLGELTRRNILGEDHLFEISGLDRNSGFSLFFKWLKVSDPQSIFHKVPENLYGTEELFMQNQNDIWARIQDIRFGVFKEVGT